MKEFKGTKGEYYPVKYVSHWSIQNQNTAGNFDVLDCYVVGENQAAANAKLFAASKDLLEAAMDMVKGLNKIGYGTILETVNLKSAITKALGE